MNIRNSFFLYSGLLVFGFFLSLLISYNLSSEKTPQHTSTVSGSSGELICNSSCIVEQK